MFIAVTMFLVSCEEHLDVPPVSDITSASYWTVENDAASYLTGIYAEYRGLTNTHLYSERRADLLENGPQAPLMANEFNHTLNVDVNGQNWRGFYEVIHHCNLLLNKMDELEIGDNDIRAQALSLRALTYFGLIKAFGDVPLNLEPTLSVPDEMLARTPVAQIMTQIKSDIDDAIAYCMSRDMGVAVFVLDIYLGEKSGFDFLDQIVERFPSAREDTIIITGNASNEVVNRCISSDVTYLLEKPIRSYALQLAVRAIVMKYVKFAKRLFRNPTFAARVKTF